METIKKGIAMKINKYIALIAALALSSSVLGAESVRNKLDRIVVKEVGIDRGFTMEEVLEVLSDASGGEINFLYFPAVEIKGGPVNLTTNGLPAQINLPAVGNVSGIPPFGIPQAPLRLDPNTGLPISPVLGNPDALAKGEAEPKIRGVHLRLKNVSLRQFVDIVSMSFDKPVQPVVTTFGVVFVPRKTALFNRVYQINPRRLNNLKNNK